MKLKLQLRIKSMSESTTKIMKSTKVNKEGSTINHLEVLLEGEEEEVDMQETILIINQEEAKDFINHTTL